MYKLFQSKAKIYWNLDTLDYPDIYLEDSYFNWEEVPTNNINFLTWDTGEIVVKDRTITCFKIQKDDKWTMWLVKRVKKILKEGYVLELEIDIFNTYTRWFLQSNPNLFLERTTITPNVFKSDYFIKVISKDDDILDNLILTCDYRIQTMKRRKLYDIKIDWWYNGDFQTTYIEGMWKHLNYVCGFYNTLHRTIDFAWAYGENPDKLIDHGSNINQQGNGPTHDTYDHGNGHTINAMIDIVAGVPSENTFYKEGAFIGAYIAPPFYLDFMKQVGFQSTQWRAYRYIMKVWQFSLQDFVNTPVFIELKEPYLDNPQTIDLCTKTIMSLYDNVLSGTYFGKMKSIYPIIKYGGKVIFNDGFLIYPNSHNFSSSDFIVYSGRIPSISSEYSERLKKLNENAQVGWNSWGLKLGSHLYGSTWNLAAGAVESARDLNPTPALKGLGEFASGIADLGVSALTMDITNKLDRQRVSGSYNTTNTDYQYNSLRYKQHISISTDYISATDNNKTFQIPYYSSSVLYKLDNQSQQLLENQIKLFGNAYSNYLNFLDIYNEPSGTTDPFPFFIKVNESWLSQIYPNLFKDTNWTMEEQKRVVAQLAGGIRMWRNGIPNLR